MTDWRLHPCRRTEDSVAASGTDGWCLRLKPRVQTSEDLPVFEGTAENTSTLNFSHSGWREAVVSMITTRTLCGEPNSKGKSDLYSLDKSLWPPARVTPPSSLFHDHIRVQLRLLCRSLNLARSHPVQLRLESC